MGRGDSSSSDGFGMKPTVRSASHGAEIFRSPEWIRAVETLKATFPEQTCESEIGVPFNHDLTIDRRPPRNFEELLKNGGLIVVEGPDGVGKSTFVEGYSNILSARGTDVEVVREPGGTEVGERIRKILKGNTDELKGELTPETQFLLFCLSRSILVKDRIAKDIENGKVVILDRFYHSTAIYQNGVGGLTSDQIIDISHQIVGGCRPDVTLVLDMEPEIIWNRKVYRGTIAGEENDPLDPSSLEALTEIRNGYLDVLRRDHDAVAVDANQDPTDVIISGIEASGKAFLGRR